MIANQVRSRLLALPAEYNDRSTVLALWSRELASRKAHMETLKAHILGDLLPIWQAEKANEQIREAQLLRALAANDDYRESREACHVIEADIKAAQLQLEALRFERDCLVAVVSAGTMERNTAALIQASLRQT